MNICRRMTPLLVALALPALAAARPAAVYETDPTLPPQIAAEQQTLRQQMQTMVGSSVLANSTTGSARAIEVAKGMLSGEGLPIDHPQTLLLVDRSPAVQRLWVVVAMPGDAPWPVVGAVRVSTGKPGRKEHFKTPVGVFTNTAAILGYRAQGTKNEFGIRGNGSKGMRVWDFGWQTTEDWRKPGAVAVVRLEMHATDPTFLESRLGRPDSEACIRVPARFNRFMDRFGLIDSQLTALVPTSRAIAALLTKGATPTPLAGDKVVVVDTSEPGAKPSDPIEAENIERRFADWLAAQNQPRQAAVPVAPAAAATGAALGAVTRPAVGAVARPAPTVGTVTATPLAPRAASSSL